jgi:hypothetical protein
LEKQCFHFIISCCGEFHRIQLLMFKTNSFRRFCLWCSIKSWNRGHISPFTSQLAPLLCLNKFRWNLPHNVVDILLCFIDEVIGSLNIWQLVQLIGFSKSFIGSLHFCDWYF